MTKKIAITGGIGSGKSIALEYIRKLGYPAFSCDTIYRDIIESPTYIKKISEIFPNCVINGRVDRARLSKKIFQDEQSRERLNAISHPLIMKKLNENMQTCISDLVFAEVPLLFEGNYQDQFDYIFVLLRKEKNRISSLILRDGQTEKGIKRKMATQFDYSSQKALELYEKENVFLIYNDSTVENLEIRLRQAINYVKTRLS